MVSMLQSAQISVFSLFCACLAEHAAVPCYFCLHELGVDNSSGNKRLFGFGSLEEKVAHDDEATHLNHTASHEVKEFLIVGIGNLGDSSIAILGEFAENFSQRSELTGVLFRCVSLDQAAVSSGGDVADGSNDLKLSGSQA